MAKDKREQSIEGLIADFEGYAPPSWQAPWDNCGWQIAPNFPKLAAHVLVCLTPTIEVLKEAQSVGANLVFAHHPMIFHPLKTVGTTDAVSRCIRFALRHNIAVYSAHTNLDQVEGGTADTLASALSLENVVPMESSGEGRGYGRVGDLPKALTPSDLLKKMAKVLACNTLDHGVVKDDQPISRVAVLGGSGADFVDQALAQGAQAYLTADCKFHQFQEASERGLLLVDSGHYASERPACRVLVAKLLAMGAAKVGLSKDDQDFRAVSRF